MRRRPIGLIVILVLGMLVLSLGAEAEQPGKVIRIGLLSPYAPPADAEGRPSPLLDAVRHVLQERGCIEGQHFTFEKRYAAGHYERLPALAAELAQLPVDVMIAFASPAAQAAKGATRTIPIVFVNVSDPIGSGLVAHLAQPGANVTGVALLPTWEMVQKRLQLFREAVPQVSRLAVLWNPANPANATALREVEQAAKALGVHLQALAVRDPTEVESAFHAITAEQANGLFLHGDPVLDSQNSRIAQFALAHHLPTMSPLRMWVEAGGLMAYGASNAHNFQRAAALVDKILQGTTPADLPVEQPMKFEFIINLKTAKELGLTIPATLLFQADEIIR